jgi:homopolymeric O-antigen transport system ATP-binding protein
MKSWLSLIEEFIETPVKRYSSGMYLRLAFAVAAHLRTEILFLDEVLAVGDTEFQRKCLGKVEGVAKEGRTVIFVSHNLGAVTQLCPRVFWLDDGRLKLDGTAREVVSAYASQWRQATHSWQRSRSKNGDESNKEMSLLSVRLSQPEHEPDGVFSFDVPFTAEIEYELLKPTADLRIAIRVVSEGGTIIFTSSDQDKPVMSREGVRSEGRYVSVCKIPGNLLRPGKFFLSAGISRHKTWIELHENLLMFEISAVGNPLPDRLGIISPVLDWQIEKLC